VDRSRRQQTFALKRGIGATKRHRPVVDQRDRRIQELEEGFIRADPVRQRDQTVQGEGEALGLVDLGQIPEIVEKRDEFRRERTRSSDAYGTDLEMPLRL